MKRFALILIAVGSIVSNAEAGNRVKDMPQIRCNEGQKDICEGTNDQWQAQNCIDSEERSWLSSNNMMVSCKFVAGSGWQPTGICPCGCFAPSVLIGGRDIKAGERGEFTALDIAQDMGRYLLSSFAKESKVDNLIPTEKSISMGTMGTEKEPLVTLILSNGRVLKLTTKHRVVLSDGSILKAVDVKNGHLLLSSSGQEVLVERIEREPFGGNVYNFATEAPIGDLAAHLIVAEDVIVGDVVYQNELANQELALRIRE